MTSERTYGAAATTEKNASFKRFRYLLEIETPAGTYRFVRARANLTWNGNVYTKKSFLFDDAVHKMNLEMGQFDIMIGNIDGALSYATLQNDIRGSDIRLIQIWVDSDGLPVGGATDYNDLIEGRVENPRNTKQLAVLTVRVMSEFDVIVPTKTFGSQCRHKFGDEICGVSNGELTAQVLDAGCTATVLQDSARTEADDYWQDGYVVMTSGDLTGEHDRITSNTSGSVTLEIGLSAAPASGDQYTIVRGCDRTWETCGDRFSNQDLFGGFIDFSKEIVWE